MTAKKKLEKEIRKDLETNEKWNTAYKKYDVCKTELIGKFVVVKVFTLKRERYIKALPNFSP